MPSMVDGILGIEVCLCCLLHRKARTAPSNGDARFLRIDGLRFFFCTRHVLAAQRIHLSATDSLYRIYSTAHCRKTRRRERRLRLPALRPDDRKGLRMDICQKGHQACHLGDDAQGRFHLATKHSPSLGNINPFLLTLLEGK